MTLAPARALALALLALGSGCAATSLAPSIVRYEPLDPDKAENRLGVRSGPRLSTSMAKVRANALDHEVGTPLPPELGAAWDFTSTIPLGAGFAIHLGVQSEFLYGLPMPAFGVSAGVSYRHQWGAVSLAPGLAARGATDFGLGLVTTSGSVVAGDFSLTISMSEGDTARLGVTPFVSVIRSFDVNGTLAVFTGAIAFARFQTVELQVGLGRVFTDGIAWNVPLVGARTGGN